MQIEAKNYHQDMNGESFSNPICDQTRPTLWIALAIVVLGTALVDPSRLGLLLVPLSFLVTAYGTGTLLGRATGRPLLIEGQSSVLDLAVHLGVGIACLSLIAVGTALCGFLWIAGIAAVPLMGFGFWHVFHAFPRLRSLHQALSATVIAGGLAVGSTWLVAWLWATIPPTFFDELAYHLVFPQRALVTGTLEATPWVFFNLMPHASDLLLAWGMSFGGALGARATHFALWVACSISAWALAETLTPSAAKSRVALVVACALATSPTLWFLATLPFAETCLALAMVSAVILVAISPDERRPWLSFGLVLGLAATVKLAGLFWVAAGIAAAFTAKWPLRDISRALLVTLGSVLPWWVRGIVHTGNPIYPMASRFLGGTPWSEESHSRVFGDLAPSAEELGLTGILRLPLDLLQHPERFGSASEVGALAVIAVCLILTLPALLHFANITERERRLGFALTTFMLVAVAGWLFTTTTTRYFAPAFTIGLAALAGILLRFGPRMQVLVISVMLAAAGWGTVRFLTQHSAAFSSIDIALGRVSADSYLGRQLDHHAAARFVRDQLPEDAYLFFIGETRPYYFSRRSMAPSAFDRHPLRQWLEESPSVEALAAHLANEGFTHVVLNAREFKRIHEGYGVLRFSGANAETHDRRLKKLPAMLRTLFADNGIFVLEVPHRGDKARTRSQDASPHEPENEATSPRDKRIPTKLNK